MKLQEVIKRFREENNLTMQEFAARAGLSKGYISMLESGKHPQTNHDLTPSIRTYQKIAAGMGLPVDDLMRLVADDESVQIGGPSIIDIIPADVIPEFAEELEQRKRDEALLESFRELPPQVQEIVIAQTRGLVHNKRGQGSL